MQTKPYPVLIRSECFLPFGAGWDCPTPEEIRTLMQIAELTGSKAATLTGLKDSRTVRRWVGGIHPFLFRPGLFWLNMQDWVKSGRCETDFSC